MCPCESHWDSSKPCTCNCTMHEERPRIASWYCKYSDNTNTHTARPETD
jgi:hypothetical protein